MALSIAVAVLGSIGWMRDSLLEKIAVLWTVSDPTDGADAVVILGGGVEQRFKVAADLYRKGRAKSILISDVLDSSHAVVGAHSSDISSSSLRSTPSHFSRKPPRTGARQKARTARRMSGSDSPRRE
jgi:hypothetical protein